VCKRSPAGSMAASAKSSTVSDGHPVTAVAVACQVCGEKMQKKLWAKYAITGLTCASGRRGHEAFYTAKGIVFTTRGLLHLLRDAEVTVLTDERVDNAERNEEADAVGDAKPESKGIEMADDVASEADVVGADDVASEADAVGAVTQRNAVCKGCEKPFSPEAASPHPAWCASCANVFAKGGPDMLNSLSDLCITLAACSSPDPKPSAPAFFADPDHCTPHKEGAESKRRRLRAKTPDPNKDLETPEKTEAAEDGGSMPAEDLEAADEESDEEPAPALTPELLQALQEAAPRLSRQGARRGQRLNDQEQRPDCRWCGALRCKVKWGEYRARLYKPGVATKGDDCFCCVKAARKLAAGTRSLAVWSSSPEAMEVFLRRSAFERKKLKHTDVCHCFLHA